MNKTRKDKKITCGCGKILAKLSDDGKLLLWCKGCKKEIPFEMLVGDEPDMKRTN